MRVVKNKKVTAKTGDKSVMHGIEEKTALSKKKESVGIVNNAKRTLGDKAVTGREKPAPNAPKAAQRNAANAPKNQRSTADKSGRSNSDNRINKNIRIEAQRRTAPNTPHSRYGRSLKSKKSRTAYSTNAESTINTASSERAINSTISQNVPDRANAVNAPKRSAPRDIRIGKAEKEIPNALKARYKHSAVRSKKRVIYPLKQNAEKSARSKNIKVLKNGAASKSALLKARKRRIDKQIKRNKNRLHFNRVDVKRLNRKKPKQVLTYGEAMRRKKRIKAISEHIKKAAVAAPAVGAAAHSAETTEKISSAVKAVENTTAAVETAEKTVTAIEAAEKSTAAVAEAAEKAVKAAVPIKKVLSQAKDAAGKTVKAASGTARTIYKPVAAASKVIEPFSEIAANQSDSAAGDSVKFGQRSVQTVQTAAKTGESAAEKTAKGVGKTARAVAKAVDPKEREKRKLKKTVKRQVKQAKREVRAVGKTAKAAAKTTKTAAKTTAKTANKTTDITAKVVKAAAQGVARIASFIASTLPWSAIIIGIVLVVVLIIFLAMSLAGSAVGAVTGGGGWAINDTEENSESDIYDNLSGFIDDSKDVCEDNVKTPLESEISSFCVEVEDPQRIIAYTVGSNTGTVFPATGADTTINGYIDTYLADKMTDEEYAKFLAALFVLMTREKQEAEGEDDTTIYDFDFEKEDFEEFFGAVDDNECRFGSTFIIKTTVETTDEKCPDEDCDTETREGCECDSSTDPDTGEVTTFCGGHSYCPGNHTKLKA